MCVYCNRSQKTSLRIKTTATPLDFVSCRIILFCTCCDVIWDLFQYTHTEKCYLFVNLLIASLVSREVYKENKSNKLIKKNVDTAKHWEIHSEMPVIILNTVYLSFIKMFLNFHFSHEQSRIGILSQII